MIRGSGRRWGTEEADDPADAPVGRQIVKVHPLPQLPSVGAQYDPAHPHEAVVLLRSTASEALARILMLKLRNRIAERRASGHECRLRITVNAVRGPHACQQAVPGAAIGRVPCRTISSNCGLRAHAQARLCC